jgi:hypothetical protein
MDLEVNAKQIYLDEENEEMIIFQDKDWKNYFYIK